MNVRFIVAVLLSTLFVSPASVWASPSADQGQDHLVQNGDTLWELCAKRYGSGHYSRLIGLCNEIADPGHLVPGVRLRLPDIGDLLAETSLPTPLDEQLQRLWRIRMDLTGISEELDGICREAMLNREHSPWGTPAATVADHVAQILMAAAEDVGQIAARFADGGADGFGASEEGRAADNTLELLRKNLIDTARGVRYGSGYDLEMVDMRCAWVFHFGVQWAVSFQ